MGDIPARRADGAGADLPLPTDLPRRASVDGEAKRRLSADGHHPDRNPDRTRSTAQKLQDKKIQTFDVHYRLTAEPVVQRVSKSKSANPEDAPQYFMRIKVRTKREADNNVSFMKRKQLRSSGTFGLGPWPSEEAALREAKKFRNLVEYGVEKRSHAAPLNVPTTLPTLADTERAQRHSARTTDHAKALRQASAYEKIVEKAMHNKTQRVEWISQLNTALLTNNIHRLIRPVSKEGEPPVVADGEYIYLREIVFQRNSLPSNIKPI